MMKALNFYSTKDLRYEDTKVPQIEKDNEVIVKVMAVGICGSDISRYNKLGPYVPGMTWGHEYSGIVEKVGKDVKNVKPGDRIAGVPSLICKDLDLEDCEYCAQSQFARCENLTVIGARHVGAYAEYIRVPDKNCVKIPDAIDYETAAMIEPSCVVVHGFNRTNINLGDSVVVVGCGNVGLLSIKFAKLYGATKVIAVDISDKALEEASKYGAKYTINATQEDVYKKVLEYTDNKRADIVVEAAGSVKTSAEVFAYAKKGGGVLFMGIPYGDVNIERFYFEQIVRSELDVWGSWSCISAPFPGKEWYAVIDLLEQGRLDLKSMISHRLSLADGPEIFDKLVDRSSNEYFGKVMFYPNENKEE